MNFNKARISKLAGLLTEGADTDECECEDKEKDGANECDMKEKEVVEIAEGFDLRTVIRNEIVRALNARSEEAMRYSSGQVFGKTAKNDGTVTMGFPGVGFKR